MKNKEYMTYNYLEKIRTVFGGANNAISYCPERGGIITSLKLSGQELLYFDKNTFCDEQKNVRGGIPILFPNAGALSDNNVFPDLKQHGFARNIMWQNIVDENGIVEKLGANKEITNLYPSNFELSVGCSFMLDNSVTLSCEVKNLTPGKDLPVAFGLHPYFKVASHEKKNIQFNFIGGEEAKINQEVWLDGGTVYLTNPKLKDKNAKLEIVIPGLGTLIMDVSNVYEKIWIWSLPEADFICIEPMLGDINKLLNAPTLIKPYTSLSADVNFKLI